MVCSIRVALILVALTLSHASAKAVRDESASPSKKPDGKRVSAALQERIARLIRELDHDEFQTREAAEAALLKIGRSATPALAEAAGKGSPEVRMRARRCLVALRKQVIIEDFTKLSKARDDSSIDLERGMWLIANVLNPTADRQTISKQLDQLAAEVRQTLGKDVDPSKADPQKVVSALRKVFFDKHSFNGNHADYDNPVNSSIESVLNTKKGLPILLSHVIVAVGDRLDVPLVGLQVPGQYMVKYDASKAPKGFAAQDIIIDPHLGGRVLTPAQLAEFIGEGYDPDLHLAPSNHRATLVRMLSNLHTHLNRDGKTKDAELVGQLMAVMRGPTDFR